MIRRGSLARWTGNEKTFPDGKLLRVHEVNCDKAIVWVWKDEKWGKKTVRLDDLEEVVE